MGMKCPSCGLTLADPPCPNAKELPDDVLDKLDILDRFNLSNSVEPPKPEDLKTVLDAARREWERQWERYEARK